MSNGPENELSGLDTGPDEIPDGAGVDGDEEALRRMLHGIVEDLQPSDGALDHLRRAVPARRARKRQALVGAAAAVLLVGTAVPAFVHVANSGGGDQANPVNAGHGEQAQGGTGNDPGATGGDKDPLSPSKGSGQDPEVKNPTSAAPGEQPGAGAGDGASGEPVPPGSAGDSVPVCAGGDLGVVSAETNPPDPEGKVYGTFRIANVSAVNCTVGGGGSVTFQAMGAADAARISVVAHTSGDPAGGLPEPSAEATSLLLKPSATYEVKFAWVPSDTCPTAGPSPDPSPSDAGSSGTSAGTGTGTSGDNTQTQTVAEDGGTQDGSVAVTHTAEAGAPSAQATITNACAGTIYRTGVLQGQ
ncbi:hypothetical protein [Streptomyces sp. ISL-10]|uniref:hypothetical protein n=1 Tax=Streptomyces sp. ISL-10 TaxID=2819172 RepID=UPI0027E48B4C|nr:hypothetical protein [Streptomyces sp. ISL-10]